MGIDVKPCIKCGESKPLDSFPKDARRRDGRYPYCLSCHVLVQADYTNYRHQGDDSRRCRTCLSPIGGTNKNRKYCSTRCLERAKRWADYGLSPSEYRRLLEFQKGRCALCGGKMTRYNIDHRHDTLETYGIVDTNCNILLGYLGHDPKKARLALSYLENPPVRSLFGVRKYSGKAKPSRLHRVWASPKEKKLIKRTLNG